MKIFLLIFLLHGATWIISAQTASVIAINANLRGTPTAIGKIVDTVSQGTEIEVVKQRGAWFLVQSREYVGWIHGDTIKLQAAETPIPTTDLELLVGPIRSTTPTTTKRDDLEWLKPAGVTVTKSSTDQPKQNVIPVTAAVSVEKATGKCKDGTFTDSSTKQGACSGHGGVDIWYSELLATPPKTTTTTLPASSGLTTGPRGGCYYINSKGNKTYVDRSRCR